MLALRKFNVARVRRFKACPSQGIVLLLVDDDREFAQTVSECLTASVQRRTQGSY